MKRKRSSSKPEPNQKQLSLFDEPLLPDSRSEFTNSYEDVHFTQPDSFSETPYRKEKQLTWRLYERIVAAVEAENRGNEMSITPNARLIGCLSGLKRQVDVLIDARWGEDISRRIIVDAKQYKRKVNIKDVEAFEAMMRDCRAERGILVCPNGFTKGAMRRAQDAITIKILSIDEVDKFGWASFSECLGQCDDHADSHSSTGIVLWDGDHLLSISNFLAVIMTGKCDVCHNFHVWCWDCGTKFALSDEDEYQCGCGHVWISAIEQEIDDPTGKSLNAVHLFICVEEEALPLDRRRLR